MILNRDSENLEYEYITLTTKEGVTYNIQEVDGKLEIEKYTQDLLVQPVNSSTIQV